tara:strand:+ start:7550 stop:7729 length:180 start_codon:yes stop_codon:yes gene_type:complete
MHTFFAWLVQIKLERLRRFALRLLFLSMRRIDLKISRLNFLERERALTQKVNDRLLHFA